MLIYLASLAFNTGSTISIFTYNTGLSSRDINKNAKAKGVLRISLPLKFNNQAMESKLDKK